jgi:hypothetical protein
LRLAAEQAETFEASKSSLKPSPQVAFATQSVNSPSSFGHQMN